MSKTEKLNRYEPPIFGREVNTVTDKEKKENLEELKDRKIEEEMLEDVAGGSVSGPIDIIGDDLSSPVAKKRRDN